VLLCFELKLWRKHSCRRRRLPPWSHGSSHGGGFETKVKVIKLFIQWPHFFLWSENTKVQLKVLCNYFKHIGGITL